MTTGYVKGIIQDGVLFVKASELTAYFYSNIIGHSTTLTEEKVTEATIQYLVDSSISEEEIKKIMISYTTEVMTPYNLPDSLWIVNPKVRDDKSTGEQYEIQDNLIKRNEFYYHPKLMLRSKMPKIVKGKEIVEPYYCEPLCRFTVSDLIDYFCDKIQVHKMYMDNRYAVNSIFRNMAVYRKASTVIDPLDIMLYSIDFAADEGNYHFSTFMQLQQYLGKVVENLKARMAFIKAYGYDKIVWRADLCLLQNLE